MSARDYDVNNSNYGRFANDYQSDMNMPNQNNFNNFNFLNNLNQSLNKTLSQSVMDLLNCFVCWNPVIEPMSCPKCNNFACKQCLKAFFKNSNRNKCPLCKQMVDFKDFRNNDLIGKIADILDGSGNTKDKYNELSKLIEQAKSSWSKQTKDINAICDRIVKYKESLLEYRKGLMYF